MKNPIATFVLSFSALAFSAEAQNLPRLGMGTRGATGRHELRTVARRNAPRLRGLGWLFRRTSGGARSGDWKPIDFIERLLIR
jgi:hypothetical protein